MLLDQIQDLVTITDLDGNIIYVNEANARRRKKSREELVGEFVSIYSEDPLPGVTQQMIIEETLETGEWRGEIVNYAADGERFVLDCRTKLLRDEIGNPMSMIGFSTDITKRKQAEETRERLTAQLRDQARHLEQILATVPEGVILLDAEGHVMLANPVAERALTFLADIDAFSPDQPVTHLGDTPLTELLTSPATKGLWHEVKRAGQTFEVIARPMENGHASEDWVLLLRDVTREREIQQHTQQQERLAAVGQLAAGVAHDFNNILAVILLYTQMAMDAPEVPDTTRARLATVAQEAKQASKLIDQILDFSRRSALERRPMDLAPLLKEVVNLLERTVPESIKIKLSYGVDEYTVNADPTRMQQILLNLVVNARDAMPEGGKLYIDLSRVGMAASINCVSCGEISEGEWVRIAVTDTGYGIPSEVLPHIFEPFFTTKEAGQGAGLGLAQVFGLVEQHDGHVDVTTQVGHGTTVAIYLPVLAIRQSASPDAAPQAVIRGHGETILIVEDADILRAALLESVAQLNYRTLEAANGRQALDVLEQDAEQIALVLSDLVMPVMGGQALFYALRARGLELPVVILSGHPMEKELEGLKEQGLAGWMLKPPNMEQLSQLLARVLKETREKREE